MRAQKSTKFSLTALTGNFSIQYTIKYSLITLCHPFCRAGFEAVILLAFFHR